MYIEYFIDDRSAKEALSESNSLSNCEVSGASSLCVQLWIFETSSQQVVLRMALFAVSRSARRGDGYPKLRMCIFYFLYWWRDARQRYIECPRIK